MADYISKFKGKEIDEYLTYAQSLPGYQKVIESELNNLQYQIDSANTQLTDHETRITNNYHSILAIGGVATANQTAIEQLQAINETNATRFAAMDQQITELYGSADTNASAITALQTKDTEIVTALSELDNQCDINNSRNKNGIAVNTSAIGMSRRNLLPNIASSTTKNGITFTVNDDGSVSVSGTATATSALDIGKTTLTAGEKYTLSGCPEGGDELTYSLYGLNTTSWVGLGGRDTGGGHTFTASAGEVVIRVNINQGTTVDNLTFYPMLRYAAVTDGTYETYTPSLLERIEALEAKILSLTEVSE